MIYGDSDSVDSMQFCSNLEQNCGQIFSRGPAMTKDIMEKIQPKAAKEITICGLKIKDISVLLGLFFLFIASFTGTCLMWGTNYWSEFMLSHVVLQNNTEAFRVFQKFGAPNIVKVHIFNYTNIKEVESGIDTKYNVEDIGPFVYEQYMERHNLEFNEQHTEISYNEFNKFKFIPKLSFGHRKNHILTVPNMLMLSAAAMGQEQMYLTRVAMSALFRGINARPFRKIPADSFIFGYDDSLYSLAKNVLSKNLPFEKFGVLAHLNGTSPDRLTINTGLNDITQLGLLKSINGRSSTGHWSGDCAELGGTNGVNVPPLLVQHKSSFDVYLKDMCRKVRFDYEREIKIMNNSLTAYRYVLPTSVFHHPDTEPDNQCYCDQEAGTCPPRGLYNSTSCAFGSPIFMSLPHMLDTDSDISGGVTGLKPDIELHGSYLHMQPFMGFPMEGKTRLQLNIQVQKSLGITQLDRFEDGVVLPVAWMEFGNDADNLPEEVHDLFHKIAMATGGLQLAIKYGLLLITILTFLFTLMVLHSKRGLIRGRTTMETRAIGQRA